MPNPSSAASIRTHLGPYLGWAAWEGMLGVLGSLSLQRPLLPSHPSWHVMPGTVVYPLPVEAASHQPLQPGLGPMHPLSSQEHLSSPYKAPQDSSPAFEARNSTIGPSVLRDPPAGGPLGTSRRPLSRCGAQASGCGPGWSPLTPSPSQPAGSPGVRTEPTIYLTAWCLRPRDTREPPNPSPRLLRA